MKNTLLKFYTVTIRDMYDGSERTICGNFCNRDHAIKFAQSTCEFPEYIERVEVDV